METKKALRIENYRGRPVLSVIDNIKRLKKYNAIVNLSTKEGEKIKQVKSINK